MERGIGRAAESKRASDRGRRTSAIRIGRTHEADMVAVGIDDDRVARAPECVVWGLRIRVPEADQLLVDRVDVLACRDVEGQHDSQTTRGLPGTKQLDGL